MTRHLSDRDGVDVTLIVDSAAGHFMPEVDRVLVGMDCIVDDTLYNRIGTYPIATAAADNDVPVTVVGAAAKSSTGHSPSKTRFAPSRGARDPADGSSSKPGLRRHADDLWIQLSLTTGSTSTETGGRRPGITGQQVGPGNGNRSRRFLHSGSEYPRYLQRGLLLCRRL